MLRRGRGAAASLSVPVHRGARDDLRPGSLVMAAPGGRGHGGLTLVELVVTMLILTVGLVSLAAAMPPALQGVVDAGRQATATLLAQQTLDQARGQRYEALCALDTGGAFAAVSGHRGFSRRVEVAPLAAPCPGAAGGGTLATITVTVRVAGPAGAGMSAPWDTTLVTLRSR